MARTFEQILASLQAEQAQLMQQRSVAWYLRQIKQLVEVSEKAKEQQTSRAAVSSQPSSKKEVQQTIKNAKQRETSQFDMNMFGKMVFFRYLPKLRQTLPYWDEYPLVVFLVPTAGQKVRPSQSMLGLNLHYLPPYERAKFMDALYTLINTTENLSPVSQIMARYITLKSVTKFRFFRPCIKRYLTAQLRSRITVIHPEQWNNILMLPAARWHKASEYKVWADSIKMINTYRSKAKRGKRKK